MVADQSWWPFWEEEASTPPPQQQPCQHSDSQRAKASSQDEEEDGDGGAQANGSGSGQRDRQDQAWLSGGEEQQQQTLGLAPQTAVGLFASPRLQPAGSSGSWPAEGSAGACDQTEHAQVRRRRLLCSVCISEHRLGRWPVLLCNCTAVRCSGCLFRGPLLPLLSGAARGGQRLEWQRG